MDWRNLPSLPALRAFEAAARTGSHSAAARELNVTHAAIAQHVRTLEAHFGQSLLTRAGQGMTPTPEGALLAASLSEGFTTIANGCQRLSDLTRDRPLVISCTPSFAENWLMPRIGAFWADHPEIEVAIRPGNTVVDLRRDGVDLAVRYGRGVWPGLDATPLFLGDFTICAAPSMGIAPVQDVRDLQHHVWLMDDSRAEQHILARDLCLDEGCMDIRTFATNGMILAAARAGLGLTLQSRALAARDLASGALIEVGGQTSKDLGYWIVTHPGQTSDRVRTLARWLRRQT